MQIENTENETLKLVDFYDKVGWLDVGLTVLEVLYMGLLIGGLIEIYGNEYFMENMFTLTTANVTMLGIFFIVAFTAVSMVNVVLTVKLRKLGHLGIIRTSIRLFWDSAWIGLNIWFLAMFIGIL